MNIIVFNILYFIKLHYIGNDGINSKARVIRCSLIILFYYVLFFPMFIFAISIRMPYTKKICYLPDIIVELN